MNVYWVSTPKVMSSARVREDITKLLKYRFGIAGTVKGELNHFEVDVGRRGGVSVKLETPNKLAFKTGPERYDQWIGAWLRTELAYKYGGTCSSEYDDTVWEPKPEKFKTFADFLTQMSLTKEGAEEAKRVYLSAIPKELR